MAVELRITPEWFSKIINGKVAPSEDIGLRLDDFIRRRRLEPGSIPQIEASSSLHEGPQAPYGTISQIKQELRDRFETLLIGAHEDRDRLGWIGEQLRAHLTPPKHWLSDDEINRRALELATESSAQPRPSGHPANRPAPRRKESA
jgi:hypothetical protein